ncbi:MAG: SDR family oxidoreductase, partial [Colwellia sp.]
MSFSNTLLLNKKILITGAGKGIGKACALLAAKCGASVIAVARTKSDLDELAKLYPNNIECWNMDVTDDAFLNRVKSLTTLHGLINNVGLNRVAPM